MVAPKDEAISIASGHHPTLSGPEPHGLPVSCQSWVLTPLLATSPSPVSSVPDIPLTGTPLLGCPFADLAIHSKGKWDHSPSDSPNHLNIKWTCITSPEVEIGSEHSSTQGNNHMPDLTPETGTSSRQQRQRVLQSFL